MIRKFKIGKLIVDDPAPQESNLNKVFEQLVIRFPHCRFSSLFASDATPNPDNPNELIYDIPLVSKARTNG